MNPCRANYYFGQEFREQSCYPETTITTKRHFWWKISIGLLAKKLQCRSHISEHWARWSDHTDRCVWPIVNCIKEVLSCNGTWWPVYCTQWVDTLDWKHSPYWDLFWLEWIKLISYKINLGSIFPLQLPIYDIQNRAMSSVRFHCHTPSL